MNILLRRLIEQSSSVEELAELAYEAGFNEALDGLLSTSDVASRLSISTRRARALIVNRHIKYNVGIRLGTDWFIHERHLKTLEPYQ